MNIIEVIESVVDFGGGSTPHEYEIIHNHRYPGSSSQDVQHKGVVMLPNNPKLKLQHIQRHIAPHVEDVKNTFEDHIHTVHVDHPSNGGNVYAGHWVEKEDGEGFHEFLHKFTPVKS